MKDFVRGAGFKILIAVILILLGFIMYTASVGSNFLSSAIGFLTTPMQKITAEISYAAEDLVPEEKNVEELRNEIAALEKEVQDLRAITVDYYDIKKENAQYAKYYDIKQKNTSLKFVPASVIGRDPNENFYGFTLDEGSISGILENDPVITENGLVGWVYHVNPTSCKVRTILSPETKVGAIAVPTGDSGVITGSVTLCDQNLTKLSLVSGQNTLQPGDILVTSGLSGMYPKNLQIGSVQELSHDEFDASIYAIVKPFEDITTIRDVFIVTDFQGKGTVVTTPAKEQLVQTKEQVASSGAASEGE